MAENEALFREVNERVRRVAQRDKASGYFCECANVDCTFRLNLAFAEYEAIRADSRQFVVLPDHYTPEVETLVTENESHSVVRKTGEAGEFVEKLDPRTRTR